MGRKSFMSPIWLGEIFCTPEVIAELQSIGATGYEPWDVLIHKTGLPAEKVKQIYVNEIAQPGFVVPPGHKGVICPECGETKYYAHMRGIMEIRKDAINPDLDFQLTHEWFGCGYVAFHEVLISNRVAQLFLDKKYQGIRLKVVNLV